jgi:glutaconate CoA-transferase subunit A
MAAGNKLTTLEAAASLVPDGARIAFGGGGALMRRPMAFARELVRRGVSGLNVFHMLGGIETDLLIGAGAVASTNCAYLGLLEHGQAPAFQRAAREGALTVNEYSEFMYIAGLRAAELGLPFIPWKTPWGSDMVERLGIKTVNDPYSDAVLLAVPATEPDLIWDYDYLVAKVAKTTIVCAEEISPPRDPARVAIVGREVTHVVEAPGGAWPTGLHPRYGPDTAHVVDVYLPAAAEGADGLSAYFDEFVAGAEVQRAG